MRHKNKIIQQGDAFEDSTFKPGLKFVKFYNRLLSLSSSCFCKLDTTNGFLTVTSSLFSVFLSQLFRPGLIPLSLIEGEYGCEIVTASWGH